MAAPALLAKCDRRLEVPFMAAPGLVSTPISIARWEHTLPDHPNLDFEVDTLVMRLNAGPGFRLRGSRREQVAANVGDLGLLPRGSYGSWTYPGYKERAHRVLHLYLPRDLMKNLSARMTSGSFALRDDTNFADVALMSLLRQIDAELDHEPPEPLYLEGLLHAVAARLVTRHAVRAGRLPYEQLGRAGDWRVRRAIECLEARLGDDVTQTDLAAVVDVTPTHLANLFKAHLGETPYRWLMRRRFERACELLQNSGVSVTEIAHSCGFASSQHLATVFKKRLAVSPSRYRRELFS